MSRGGGDRNRKSLTPEKKAITEKRLELSPRPKKETTTSKSTSVLTDITWSSSGSDVSDEDKILSESQRDEGNGSRIDRFCNRNILCPEDGASEDERQFIDWEINSDREDAGECSEFDDGEHATEISDSASGSSSHSLTSDERLSELPKPSSTEILEYSSDSEKEDHSENVLFIDSESPHKYHVDVGTDARQIMETLIDPRVKLTEDILCTPWKQTAKFPRTPENSGKKTKLLRGGLAERLNGLQNRERSAISLWRHQYVSYQRTLSGRKSGVLIVRILELYEECTMQVAMCEQLVGPPATSPSHGVAPRPGASLQVLFTKETAGCLRGRPLDIIHIFPPWQKLIIPNGSCPVILNTYFCQKVVAKEDSETTCEVHSWDTSLPRRSITLAQMFRIKGLTNNSPESQVVRSGLATTVTGWTHGHEEAKRHLLASTPLRDSLLDVVESQGAARWSGVGVRVVVQRVYSLPGRERARGQQGSGSGHTDPPGVRVCLLVQDACGMFGEVHLQGAVLKDRQLEGKACSLAGMKILQKATRARISRHCNRRFKYEIHPSIRTACPEGWPYLYIDVHGNSGAGVCGNIGCSYFGWLAFQMTFVIFQSRMAGLFSLIDTLWPPSRPLKAPGRSQPSEEVKTHLPPPTFCYILMAHPNLGQIDIIEEDPISKLYQPPIPRCLREILQTDDLGTRCSFYAKVIYQRPQLKSLLLLEQREISLLVTDATLQAKDESEPSLPKTVQVFVAPSCVLDLQVLEAFTMATPHNILFRDALRDHGQIVCVERTVILLQKPLSCVVSGVRICELTGPVTLDELDSATTANSLCSVQGAVVGVDESTAFSWPVCDQCGNGRLEQRPEDRGTFSCGDCSRVVTAPVLKRHLQVFLDCPSRPQCRVKVKSYEVQSVLGKEVGSLNCFVRSITTHPTNCVGLEEIELLGAGGTSAERLP